MLPRPVSMAVVRPVLLLHALALAFDEALLALALRRSVAVRSGTFERVDVWWRRRLCAGPVALVRGGAGRRNRLFEETASFTRVVDLDRSPVFVLGNQRVA